MRIQAGFTRVLVVNGFTDGRAMYATFLRYCGMVVRGAARPESALRVIPRFRPEIIVTDLAFPAPGLDGPGFISAVRQRHDVPAPTIIVISGFTQDADKQCARNAGADSFLIKPCLPERLWVEVRAALEMRRPVRHAGTLSRSPSGTHHFRHSA